VRIDQSGDRQLAITINDIGIRWYHVTFAFARTQDRLDLAAIDDDCSLIMQGICPVSNSHSIDHQFHPSSSALPLTVTIADGMREGNDYLTLVFGR
jgi:hypothetical protein